jgi:hypothetical protein
MTLLSVVKDVCAPIGVLIPQSVFSNITGNRTMQEMLALANEMAQRIAYDNRDWTKFKKICTLNGDGVTTAFDLPPNYKRMLLTGNVWRSTSTIQPMMFVPDADVWLNRRSQSWYDAWGEWTMLGGQMHIFPVMGADTSATFAYIDKNCVKLAGGGYGETFMDDADSFALDERLLKLAMIYQWKAYKGGAYAEDMSTFGDALTRAMGTDSPAPIIIDRRPMSHIPSSVPYASP